MKLYLFDPNEFFYIGEREATVNPRYNKKLKGSREFIYDPRKSTLIEPAGDCEEFEIEVFKNGAWETVCDFRGATYYEKDGTKVTIEKVGVEIPDGVLTYQSPLRFHTTHDGEKWILDAARKKKHEDTQYKRDRVIEYIPIKDQLDLIYWDKKNNTNNFCEYITSVKMKYPKPTEE